MRKKKPTPGGRTKKKAEVSPVRSWAAEYTLRNTLLPKLLSGELAIPLPDIV